MKAKASQKQRYTFEHARSTIEIVANNIYYSISLNNHLMKLSNTTAMVITLDELLESDFIIGNLVIADSIIQKTQKISA